MTPFRPFAAIVAWAAAIGGIAYGIAFVIAGNIGVASTLLLVGGVLTALIVSALATSVESGTRSAARFALMVGTVGATGSAIHGGYDLANVIHPPAANLVSLSSYPNQIDPRGIATFGLVGLALIILTTLMRRNSSYPAALGQLGQVLGTLTIVVYLGRLIILDPTNPIVRTALAAGVLANTSFLGWLGSVWHRGSGDDLGQSSSPTGMSA